MLWSSVLYKPLTCHDTIQEQLINACKWISSGMDLCIFPHHGKLISYFQSDDSVL